MPTPNKTNADNCATCGETMRMEQCPCCGGHGFVKNLLIESECSGCEGRGHVLRCPNEFQHMAEPNHALLPELKANESHLPPVRPLRSQEKEKAAALQTMSLWAEDETE